VVLFVDNFTDGVKCDQTNDSLGYTTDHWRPWNISVQSLFILLHMDHRLAIVISVVDDISRKL